MKKKLLLSFIASALALCSAAQAAGLDSVEYNVGTATLSVSGTADTDGRTGVDQATLRVFRPGMTAEKIAELDDEEKKDAIAFVSQSQIGQDGSFSFTYSPGNIESGNHKIYVTVPGGSVWSQYVLIIDSEKNAQLLNDLNAADSKEKMQAALEKHSYILSDIETIDEIKAAFPEEDVTALVAGIIAGETFPDSGDAVTKAIKAAVVVNINLVKNADEFIGVLNKYNKELEISENRIYSDLFKSIEKNVSPEFIGRDYKSFDEFIKDFCDTVIVRKVNGIKNYTEVMPILDADRTYLSGFDFKGYDALTSAQKNAVCKKVADSGEYASVDKIQSVFNGAVDNPPVDNPSQGQGGGGSNQRPSSGQGSSSSGTGGSANIAKETKPEKEPEEIFEDLSSAEWARESILALYEKGIVSGMGEKRFEPAGLVTREQFAKMIISSCGLYNESAECSFKDAERKAWYYSFVSSAWQSGVVYGISEELFGIGNNITREDMAVMAFRAADKTGIQLLTGSDAIDRFEDDENISDYAKQAVYALKSAGVMSGKGDNRFEPKAFATRAEAAKMIYGLISLGGAE